jgi:hypothetical protein
MIIFRSRLVGVGSLRFNRIGFWGDSTVMWLVKNNTRTQVPFMFGRQVNESFQSRIGCGSCCQSLELKAITFLSKQLGQGTWPLTHQTTILIVKTLSRSDLLL